MSSAAIACRAARVADGLCILLRSVDTGACAALCAANGECAAVEVTDLLEAGSSNHNEFRLMARPLSGDQ